MIKKLKRKIFWSVELSAMAVLLIVLVFLNVLNIARYEQDQWKIMSAFQSMKYEDEGGAGGRGHGKGNEMLQALMNDEMSLISLDSSGTITSVTGAAAADDLDGLSELTDQILAKGEERGKIGMVRYLVQKGQSETLIVLSDQGAIPSTVFEAILLSLVGLLAASILFALLAWRLSEKLAHPVEETLEDQKRFIADASHEMKTPVTVINANISILEKEFGQNKWLEFIKDAGGRLSGLVGSMLEYARVDYAASFGTQEVPPVRFNAADAVVEAALPFESVAYEAGLSLKLDLPESVEIIGQPESLKNIVGILLDNAVKHADPGSAVSLYTVNDKTHKKRRGESEFSVCISNTGETIPAEQLPCLFHRFYRADPSRKNDGNRFGLGLAIADALAEKSGGSIGVSSKDRVTVFTVSFPVAHRKE